MTPEEVKQKRRAVLDDTVNHFNSKNRSVSDPGAGKMKVCLYSGVGCAIGRLIEDKDLCARLDTHPQASVGRDEIFCQLPQELQELGKEFLNKLQRLHDDSTNWQEDGPSPMGYTAADAIRLTFC